MKSKCSRHGSPRTKSVSRFAGVLFLLVGMLLSAGLCFAHPPNDHPVPSIFEPHSAPTQSIYHLSVFVLVITAVIFLTVFSLLTYAIVKFRKRANDANKEPVQVYGSTTD